MTDSTFDQATASQAIDQNVEGLANRLLTLTLAINVLLPAAMFLVVYILRATAILPSTPLVAPDVLQVLFYALIFVAVSEMAVAFVLKRTLFAPDKLRSTLADSAAFAKLVTGGSIALAALGAAAMIYGVVLYLLGMEVTKVALFALIALVHFRLFRPTAGFLRGLITQAS